MDTSFWQILGLSWQKIVGNSCPCQSRERQSEMEQFHVERLAGMFSEGLITKDSRGGAIFIDMVETVCVAISESSRHGKAPRSYEILCCRTDDDGLSCPTRRSDSSIKIMLIFIPTAG